MKFNKLIIAFVTAASVCGGSALANAEQVTASPTLYGNLIYTRTWGNEDATMAGIYKFSATENTTVSLEYKPETSNIYSNGGATYANGKYYSLMHTPNTGKVQQNYLYTYNTDTWTLESRIEIPLTTVASDLTYNPVDKKIYGVFTNTTSSGYVFGTLDVSNGEVNVIKAIDLKDSSSMPTAFMVVAANADGDVYGIASTGQLYRFDRNTGDLTLIGATGFTPARWNQSGCFDFTTKEFYWAACNADLSALFKVDTTTGAATRVCTFKDDEEFTGLYSLSDVADLNGPQAVSNLIVSLEGNALAGTISFTMPDVTIAGQALAGNLSYTIEDNGAPLLTGSATAGSTVTRDITLKSGAHSLVVYVSQTDNRGASARIYIYAGDDTPAAPANVNAKLNGSSVDISWDAVTTGASKGYIDPSKITYTVTRKPDNVTVATGLNATSCTDSALPESLGDYTYEVTATYAGQTGVGAISNALTLGSSVTPPYALDFTDEEQFKFCTVIDANDDKTTWTWSVNGARCNYHRTNATDDWLITPAISFKAGYQYTIEIVARSSSSRYKERFEVMGGTSATAEAMTVRIMAPTELTTGSKETITMIYTPAADGTYNVGIHGISDPYMGGVYMYSLSISEPISTKAPIAATGISATAAEMGALEATVTATAPVKAVDGTGIASLVKAELINMTTGKVAGTIDSPAPGAQIAITDKSPVNGINEYALAFYNEAGKGYSASASVYVGEDTPSAVTGVILQQDGNTAKLTWQAPTTGVNGGYINPATLTYRVTNSSTSADVATGLKDKSYTDSSLPVDKQQVLQYTVFASNAGGESIGTASNSLVFGTPYPAPFAESFAGGREQMTPWTTTKEGDRNYADWSPTTKSMFTDDISQDGDAGWIAYSGPGTVNLCSPLINISTLSAPVLKYWQQATSDAVSLDIKLTTDQGLTWQTLQTSTPQNENWECVSVDLAKFAGAMCIQIAFTAKTTDYEDLRIDNIRITDSKEADLGISSFTGPLEIVGGTSGKYDITVLNDGKNTAATYTVNIYGDNELMATAQGTDLAPDAFGVTTLEVPVPVNANDITLRAEVVLAGDVYAANDTATLKVSIVAPRLPVISNLTATYGADGVKLTWSKPEMERNPEAATDDFENLTNWDFGGITTGIQSGTIGEYSVYDADNSATVIANMWAKHPNATNPMAFQVVKVDGNPEMTRYNINAHSGSKILMAWNASSGTADDWLILPQLFNGETAISFWAYVVPDSYGKVSDEKIEILYSTTGNAIADFKRYGEALTVKPGWTSDPEKGYQEYKVTLPSDAKYVAIRALMTGETTKGIAIDDLRYTSAKSPMEQLTLNGYNVYRDGEKLATVTGEGYTDTTGTSANVYNVTSSFSIGESGFSNDAQPITTGVDGIEVTGYITAIPNGINITGLSGQRVMVYNLSGMLIADKTVSDNETIPVATGMYLVRVNEQTVKVAVK